MIKTKGKRPQGAGGTEPQTAALKALGKRRVHS